MKLRNLLLATALMGAANLVFTSTASATVGLGCTDFKQEGSVDIGFGAGPGPSILNVSINLGTHQFTTTAGQPGTQAVIVQNYIGDDVTRVDLADTNATKLLAKIRILRSSDNGPNPPEQVGFVEFEDGTAIGITCEGP